MPKYIYPVTKVCSSGINFLISMIPLVLVALLTGEPVTAAYLALPYAMVCVTLFSIGWGMLLAALMVFFRDVQFLWGVFSMLWMYMTPLFYPENILADRFMWMMNVNPMCRYVKFFREVVIDGTVPQPELFVECFLFAAAAVLVGGVVFRRTQDRFIFHI